MARTPKRPLHIPKDARFLEGLGWSVGKGNKNNDPVGEWTSWRVDGTLETIRMFDANGRATGPYRSFHEDGSLAEEGHMVNNSPRVGKTWTWCRGPKQRKWAPIDNEPVGSAVKKATAKQSRQHEWIDRHYYDADGRECTATGTLLSARQISTRANAPRTAQEKLAALVAKPKK